MRTNNRVNVGIFLIGLGVMLFIPGQAMAQRAGFMMRGGMGWGGGNNWGMMRHNGWNGGGTWNSGWGHGGFGNNGFATAGMMAMRPAGTTTINLTHPTASSTFISVTGPMGTSTTRFTAPTTTTTRVNRTSDNTFTNATSAFRAFSKDLHQFGPIVNGSTTATRNSATSTTFTTQTRAGQSVTTISNPSAGMIMVTNRNPFGHGTLTLTQTASSDRVQFSNTTTFNDALQGFRSFNPSFGSSQSSNASASPFSAMGSMGSMGSFTP